MKLLISLFAFVAFTTSAFADDTLIIKYASQTTIGNNTVFISPNLVLSTGDQVDFYATTATATGLCKLLMYSNLISFGYDQSGNNLVSLSEEGSVAHYYQASGNALKISSVVCSK